jgi:rod shape-determining protein MreD
MIQFIFGKYLNFFGIFPNFILIVIVYLGVSKKIINAQLMGFLFGLTWDVFSTDIFGIRALMFTVIGYLFGKFFGDFDTNKIPVQFVVIFFANVVYWFGFNLIYFIIFGNEVYMTYFFDISCCVKIIATVLIAPVIFHILEWLGIIYA